MNMQESLYVDNQQLKALSEEKSKIILDLSGKIKALRDWQKYLRDCAFSNLPIFVIDRQLNEIFGEE